MGRVFVHKQRGEPRSFNSRLSNKRVKSPLPFDFTGRGKVLANIKNL